MLFLGVGTFVGKAGWCGSTAGYTEMLVGATARTKTNLSLEHKLYMRHVEGWAFAGDQMLLERQDRLVTEQL